MQFLWLVRDFSLKLVSNGHEISPKEYLENSLQPLDVRVRRLSPRVTGPLALLHGWLGRPGRQGDPDRVKDRNLIRSSITQYFPDRLCFTLKRPVNDEKQLQARVCWQGRTCLSNRTPNGAIHSFRGTQTACRQADRAGAASAVCRGASRTDLAGVQERQTKAPLQQQPQRLQYALALEERGKGRVAAPTDLTPLVTRQRGAANSAGGARAQLCERDELGIGADDPNGVGECRRGGEPAADRHGRHGLQGRVRGLPAPAHTVWVRDTAGQPTHRCVRANAAGWRRFCGKRPWQRGSTWSCGTSSSC